MSDDTKAQLPDAATEGTQEAPKQPPRPENPNIAVLKAAFPDVDSAVISAVLIASSNNLEKAFDGLLGMSDPNFRPELSAPPVQPTQALSDEQERQILADEQFARQLAAQSTRRARARNGDSPAPQEAQEPEHSFLDDDLPVLKENIIQGFNETKLKVGSFISNLRTQYNQRMDTQGSRDDTLRTHQPDLYHQHPRSSTTYDRDARSLDDDFGELQLQDNTIPGATAIPGAKEKAGSDGQELSQSAGIGPSKSTPTTSRWEPIPITKNQKTEAQPFSLGDDEDDD